MLQHKKKKVQGLDYSLQIIHTRKYIWCCWWLIQIYEKGKDESLDAALSIIQQIVPTSFLIN